MPESIQHDPAGQRFFVDLEGGETAHLLYRMRDARTMDAVSTYTPPSARGSGVASRLVRVALDHARAAGWRVVPSCWYVAGWIERHPDYEDLLA